MINTIIKFILITAGTLAYLSAFFAMLVNLLTPFNMKRMIFNTLASLLILWAIFAFLYWQHYPGEWAERDRKTFILLALLTPGVTFITKSKS